MKYKFTEDFKYIHIKQEDGILTIPFSQLTDEQKKSIYEEKYES